MCFSSNENNQHVNVGVSMHSCYKPNTEQGLRKTLDMMAKSCSLVYAH